jgi:hypothetical protein
MKQAEKERLWLNDGSCVRLRPEYRNHVWSYDFVHHRTDDGKVFRTLNILDEHSRECLAIRVMRKLNSTDVIDVLTDLFILRGVTPRAVTPSYKWLPLSFVFRMSSSKDRLGMPSSARTSRAGVVPGNSRSRHPSSEPSCFDLRTVLAAQGINLQETDS